MKSLAPGGNYTILDYQAVDWNVEKLREDGNAVTGQLTYAFIPDMVSDSAFWWIPNTSVGKGEYEGWYRAYRTFALIKEEDGYWRCCELGTGFLDLPQ